MNIRQHQQTGFGAIAIIAIVAVVAVVGGTGFFVYQHNKTKTTDAAATSAGATTTPVAAQPTPPVATPLVGTTNQNIVNLPDLGISITVPDTIKDITYQTSKVTLRNGKQATLVMFSTKTLAAADAKCGASSGPLGSLERVDGQYPTFTGSDPAPGAPIDYGQLVKQYPTFYITAGYPNGSCSSDPASMPQPAGGGDWKSVFSGSLSTIQATN